MFAHFQFSVERFDALNIIKISRGKLKFGFLNNRGHRHIDVCECVYIIYNYIYDYGLVHELKWNYLHRPIRVSVHVYITYYTKATGALSLQLRNDTREEVLILLRLFEASRVEPMLRALCSWSPRSPRDESWRFYEALLSKCWHRERELLLLIELPVGGDGLELRVKV